MPLETKTKLILLIHAHEIKKPTNTGRLAAACVKGSEVHVRGRVNEPIKLDSLADEARQPLVLFPSDDAQVLTAEYVKALEKPVTLIVPDGNWGQASRMPRREESIKNLPRVILPKGEPTQYRLRNEPHKDFGLATLEAVARALGILDGPAIQQEMERVFRIMVERTLWSKGKMRAEEVFGGVQPFT